MQRSTIAVNIRTNPHLIDRVEMLRTVLELDDRAPVDPTARPSMDTVMLYVGADPELIDHVEQAMGASENPDNAVASILEITDEVLEPAVLRALTRLAA